MLYRNTDAVRDAQAKIKSLASSRRSRRQTSSCGEVILFSSQLTVLSVNSPSSPTVLVLALKISGVVSVSCSEQEKQSLNDVDSAFEQALDSLTSALVAVQEQIEGLLYIYFFLPIILISYLLFQY